MKTLPFLVLVPAILIGGATSVSGQRKDALQPVDLHGDPLPPGASARLGTSRFRSADGFQSLAYTPDGRYLVSGGGGGARAFDAATGRLVRRFGADLPQPSGPADLSPDGKLIAVGGWGDDMGGCAVYELTSGKQLYRFGTGGTNQSGRFSPDGKILAHFPRNDGAIVLLDAVTGKELRALKGDKIISFSGSVVWNPAFTPDSKTLVSAGVDGMIRFWDVQSGKEIRTIAAADVAGLALSPDGTVVASRAWKRVETGPGSMWSYPATDIKLWNAHSGKETNHIPIRPLKKNDGVEYGPWFLAFSPDGQDLVTTGWDGGLRVWDIATGKERRRFAENNLIRAVAFSPKGQLACIEGSIDGHSIRLRDYLTGRDLAPIAGHRSEIERAASSPDGRTVALSSYQEHGIILWDAETGREKRRVSPANESIQSLLLARDGRSLLAITKEKSLWTWDMVGEREPRRLKLSRSGALRSSPDGNILAIGERDKIYLFDATDGKELRTLEGTGPSRAGFDFTPDGRAILAWTGDGKLHRWNTLTGAHSAKDFYRLASWPFSTVFSPNGRFITFGVQNSDFLPVVDLATGKEVCRFDLIPLERSQTLAWIAFAPDSRSLAWGGRKDGSAWLGELATGAVRQQLAGHSGRVRSLAFSADGRTLVTGSADTTALVWKLTGRLPSDDARTDVLTEAELTASWNDFREKDGKRAYTALRRLTADPARSVAFLNQRLNPVPEADARRVATLIVNLEDGNFVKRERATRELEKIAEPALRAIAKKLKEKPALETARRLETLIGKIEILTPERLQALRAVEALELIGTSEARKLLACLAKGFPNARLTRETSESLGRLESLPARR